MPWQAIARISQSMNVNEMLIQRTDDTSKIVLITCQVGVLMFVIDVSFSGSTVGQRVRHSKSNPQDRTINGPNWMAKATAFATKPLCRTERKLRWVMCDCASTRRGMSGTQSHPTFVSLVVHLCECLTKHTEKNTLGIFNVLLEDKTIKQINTLNSKLEKIVLQCLAIVNAGGGPSDTLFSKGAQQNHNTLGKFIKTAWPPPVFCKIIWGGGGAGRAQKVSKCYVVAWPLCRLSPRACLYVCWARILT